MSAPEIEFTISGSVFRLLTDGNWPSDNEAAWALVEAAPIRPVGKGTQHMISLSVEDANDLADYLWSVAEVAGVGEGSDSGAATAARRACANIEAAIKVSTP